MNIYFIGYRSSGKTTISGEIAIKLGISFSDTDDEISFICSVPIYNILKHYGWKFFRTKEKEILTKLSYKRKSVISTGGGIILKKKNVLLMKKTGIIVMIQSRIREIKKYILKENILNNKRISLTGESILKDINKTFVFRKHIYKKVCDLVLSVDNFDVDFISDTLLYRITTDFNRKVSF